MEIFNRNLIEIFNRNYLNLLKLTNIWIEWNIENLITSIRIMKYI